MVQRESVTLSQRRKLNLMPHSTRLFLYSVVLILDCSYTRLFDSKEIRKGHNQMKPVPFKAIFFFINMIKLNNRMDLNPDKKEPEAIV